MRQYGLPGIAPVHVFEWISVVPPSLLQSLVQKAVRRNEVDIAVRAAASMWSQGYKGRQKLVRRVPIIVIEDALLTGDYDRLFELMTRAGVKKYGEQREDAQFIFDVVAKIAASEWRDGPTEHQEYELADKSQYDDLPEKENAMVVAMLKRGSYGGIGGDIRMLHQMARAWTHRFLTDRDKAWGYIERAYGDGPKVDIDSLHGIQKDDLRKIPTAVDFHCSAVSYILMKKPEIRALVGDDRRLLNRVVWHFDVGINVKKDIQTGEVFDWSESKKFPEPGYEYWAKQWPMIEKELRGVQEWWIKKKVN